MINIRVVEIEGLILDLVFSVGRCFGERSWGFVLEYWEFVFVKRRCGEVGGSLEKW